MLNKRKIDVWDFGAQQFDESIYNNVLNEKVINEYFGQGNPDGTRGVMLSDVFVNLSKNGNDEDCDLMFSAGGKRKHRIRTTNPKITRFDEGVKVGVDADEVVYSGCIYSNSAPNPDVYLALTLEKNDIVTFMLGTNGKDTEYYFETLGGKYRQTFMCKAKPTVQKAVFYAAQKGVYKLYCPVDKLVVYRIYREHIEQVKVSGRILDKLPDDFRLNVNNVLTGENEYADIKGDSYEVILSSNYRYKIEFLNDKGYMVADKAEYIDVLGDAECIQHDLPVEKYEMVSVSGIIEGIPKIKYIDMLMEFKPVDKNVRYIPTLKITDDIYNINFEKGVEYKVTAYGVNDYTLTNREVRFEENVDYYSFQFEKKPVYEVKLRFSNDEIQGYKSICFTNVYEDGYSYTFKNDEPIYLRDGQYRAVAQLDGYKGIVQEVLYTKDCIVAGKKVEYEIPVTRMYGNWNFELFAECCEAQGYLAGLVTKGEIRFNKNRYLQQKKDSVITIAVKKGQRLTLKYCFMASFMIEGAGIMPQPVFSFSGSSKIEEEKVYIAKEDGEITLTGLAGVASNGEGVDHTYYISIKLDDMIEYKDEIKVGKDKECKTINEALRMISCMPRPNNERVTISIDPGNYEEMLVIKEANVTLVNASPNPDIRLCNEGVGISENAVRITSYYGHGYAYYSMGTDCKYDERLLEVNKHNARLSFVNPGTGMSAGSYWNTTVAVFADGFEAKDIIFENAFNQYVSEKAANDVLVRLPSGKGDRNGLEKFSTAIQDKQFVERAAALAIANNKGKFTFTNCRFVGRQDTLFGGIGNVVLFDKCKIMGACDYIYGGMRACFKECELILNTSEDENDVAYITAAQQPEEEPGYLMYRCRIVSARPGEETASKKMSKPGYLGRPWSITSEVLYFETFIDETDYSGKTESIILKEGWNDTLGGKAPRCYECASYEADGKNYERNRASWAKVLKAGDPFVKERMNGFEEAYGKGISW